MNSTVSEYIRKFYDAKNKSGLSGIPEPKWEQYDNTDPEHAKDDGGHNEVG